MLKKDLLHDWNVKIEIQLEILITIVLAAVTNLINILRS